MGWRKGVLPAEGDLSPARLDAWLATLAQHRPESEIALVRAAVERVQQQVHSPPGAALSRLLVRVQTAQILEDLRLDVETLVVALLADLPDLADYDPRGIEREFGPLVLQMLGDLTKLRHLAQASALGSDSQQIEALRRMLLGLADDVRVVLIFLARQLQIMRTLGFIEEDQQQHIAHATQQLYAPLANRLGIWQLKWELEDLAMRYLQPQVYSEIAGKLESRRVEREALIARVVTRIRNLCAAEDIPAEVSGRPKHIYSIWRKMQKKRLPFEQIFDVRAIRVLVEDVAQCYAVLGMVHGIWQPVPQEFDDYIARPKPNGYRSLHTAVVVEDGKPLEVQIRTFAMHQHAERGVAAHWLYKESKAADRELERRVALMRRWLEGKETADGGEDIESDSRRIYVLTPQGKVIELPKGATAVDFAYAIHSSVGHRCRGAKADGRIITLTHPLESGQSVEVLTSKEGGPSRDWLNPHSGYVVTARARERIRQWFKQQDHDQHVQLGKAALEREQQRLNLSRPELDRLPERFRLKSVEDLLAAIGRSDLSPVQVLNAAGQTAASRQEPPDSIPVQPRRPRAQRKPGQTRVRVEGVGELLTQMAKCCKPVPFDQIVGFITRGRGVTVHRRGCPVVQRLSQQDRERLVPVSWEAEQPESTFLVDIQIHAGDRKGLLRDISSVFSNEEIDVLGVKTQSDRRRMTADMRFSVEVQDVTQLSRVLDKISQIPDVLQVRRGS